MRTEPNRAKPNLSSTIISEPNLCISNSQPNQNIGSRFCALAELDPNMDTDNREIEVEVDTDTVSNPVTSSILVGRHQPEAQEAPTRQNGNENLGDKEILPCENQQAPPSAGCSSAAQETQRPTSPPVHNNPTQLGSHRPNLIPSPRYRMPIPSEGLRSPGLVRDSGGIRPHLMGFLMDRGLW